MNTKIAYVICIFILIIIGCEKDDFTTGIIGIVEYGHADCMPSQEGPMIVFNKYDGVVYFINKRVFENLGNGNFEELKGASIKTKIKNGEIALKLPVDTFLIVLEDMYQNTDNNTIIIKQGVVLERNFKIWKCTSF